MIGLCPVILSLLSAGGGKVLHTSAQSLLHQHPVLACFPGVEPLLDTPPDCVVCGYISVSLQDHFLKENEPLRVPPSFPYPTQLFNQSLDKATPYLPTWSVLEPEGHDLVPHRPWCLCGGERRCWRAPSTRGYPEVGGPPGSGCSPSDIPPPPTCSLVAAVGSSLPVSLPYWFLFREGGDMSSPCACPCLPPLCLYAPHSSLPRPLLLLWLCLTCLLLAMSSLRRNVGALTQTSEWHAGAIDLAALASRGLTRQRRPEFIASVNG